MIWVGCEHVNYKCIRRDSASAQLVAWASGLCCESLLTQGAHAFEVQVRARDVSRILSNMLMVSLFRVKFVWETYDFDDNELLCNDVCELLPGIGVFAVRGILRWIG